MGLFGGSKRAGSRRTLSWWHSGAIVDPNVGKDHRDPRLVEGLTIEAGHVSFTLQFTGEQPPLPAPRFTAGPARWFRRFLVWPTSRLDRLAHGRRASGEAWSWSRAAHVATPEELIPRGQAHRRGVLRKGGVGKVHRGRPTWRWRFTAKGPSRIVDVDVYGPTSR